MTAGAAGMAAVPCAQTVKQTGMAMPGTRSIAWTIAGAAGVAMLTGTARTARTARSSGHNCATMIAGSTTVARTVIPA